MRMPRLLIVLMLSTLPALACGTRLRMDVAWGGGGTSTCVAAAGGEAGAPIRVDGGVIDAFPVPADVREAAGAGGSGAGGASPAGLGGNTRSGGTVSSVGGRSATGGTTGFGGAGGTSGYGGVASGSGGTGNGTGGAIVATGGTGGNACTYSVERLCGSGADKHCIDVSNNEANCGQCDHVCPTGETCSNGACRPMGCTGLFTLGDLPTADTGKSPVSMATGDFDGDGRPDIATANAVAGTVSILLGKGNGTFALRVDYPTGSQPRAVAVGDFNGDAKPDLVTANEGSDSVSLLLGKGDGSFAAKADHGTGKSPRSIVVADLDGDGRLDVATANSAADTVSVLLGKGEGRLAAKVDYATGGNPCAVVAGDLDGDGRLDLATANTGSENVSALLGKGDGTFAGRIDTARDKPADARTMTIADLDGDGTLDLAVSDLSDRVTSGTMAVLHGNGDGTFSSGTAYYRQTDIAAMAPWDVDGDGRQDLAVARYGAARLLFQQKDGTLARQVDYPASDSVSAIVFADFNGDGKADLATADNRSDSVGVRLGKGDGTFAVPGELSAGFMPSVVSLADVDRDGILDIVAASIGSDSISVLLGKGGGAFGPFAVFPTGPSPESFEMVDWNGDGAPDVLTLERDGGRSLLFGSGDGTFTYAGDVRPEGAQALVVGDLNDDGKPDLVYADEWAPGVFVRLHDDDAFAEAVWYPAKDTCRRIELADIDGDGKLDVVAFTATEVNTWLGKGDGSLGVRQSSPTADEPVTCTLGDLNGDKALDLLLGFPSDGEQILLGRGDGTFASGSRIWGLGSWGDRGFGDFNGDGKLDLVGLGNGQIAVLLGAGDGTFACSLRFAVDLAGLALGDLNGDGRVDVIGANLDHHAVVYLPNLRM
jgi:hypothetical protein